MPRSTLSLPRLLDLLPPGTEFPALETPLFASKAEARVGEADALEVEVTPDRLDLLSEGGLALELQGALGVASGLPSIRPGRASEQWAIDVDPSVGPLRPHIGAVLVRAPGGRPLDEGLLAEAVRFQEVVHATVGRDRRAASLGIYPADRLEPPIRYALEPIDAIEFVPLGGAERTTAAAFLESDPMALRYGPLGHVGDSTLTLRDADGEVLSLPPILNSRGAGEARPGDRALLLESTGVRARSVREALGLLLVAFAARGWSAAPVAIRGPAPATVDDGRRLVAPHTIDLPTDVIAQTLGTRIPGPEVARLAGRARLGLRRGPGGYRVLAPPWRPDLLTAVDAVEDIALSAGVRPEDALLPPSHGRGRRRPEHEFRRRIRTLLLGLGLTEPHTPVLVPEATVRLVGDDRAIRVRNPVSAEFAYLRDQIRLAHLGVLGRNTRHAYPQRFAEVGPVVRRARDAESGAETRYVAGAMLAHEGAGFADAAALVEYVLRRLDVGSVREPDEIPGTIPGRAARVRVAGESVAELGELHPEVLAALGVPVPVAWAEVDLTALWPLVRADDTP